MTRYIVTGAGGNTGSQVFRSLAKDAARSVIGLVHSEHDVVRLRAEGYEALRVDLLQPESVARLFSPADVLVETANVRFARRLLPELERVGVRRAFCVTTTGIFSKYNQYSEIYVRSEQEMRESNVDVTILRPSMIYGNERDKNMHRLLRFLKHSPVYPLFGEGNALMQPVHVEDLSDGIARAVREDVSGEFNLAGPTPQTYRQILDLACRALGKSVHFLPVSHDFTVRLMTLFERVPAFPITREQVLRLQEDKAFDISSSRAALNFAPRPFEQGVREEVERLQSLGML